MTALSGKSQTLKPPTSNLWQLTSKILSLKSPSPTQQTFVLSQAQNKQEPIISHSHTRNTQPYVLLSNTTAWNPINFKYFWALRSV